jgi:hypothetical protein
MKTNLISILLVVCFALGCTGTGAKQCYRADAESKRVLRHCVLFKFNAETTPLKVKEIEAAFRALPSKISGIADFEWGTDVSPEKLSQGYTHCFFLTFPTETQRDIYLTHPAHKEFGALLKGHLEKVLVVDYWAQR